MSKTNKKQTITPVAPKVSEKVSGKVTTPSWVTNSKLHLWLVAVFAFCLYANTLFHDYTQDDAIVIYDNMYTTKGIAGIPGLLEKDTFYGFFKEEGKAGLVSGGRYRPFTPIMFAIEYQLFGKSPFMGHLFNILWFAFTGAVVYWVLRRLLQDRGETMATMVALGASLLFVAHPIHTEAVANIKGRDEIIALLCSLGALYYSLKSFDTKEIKWTVAAVTLLFVGMMSKENAIMFIAIIPLAYWFFTKATIPEIVKQTIPLLASVALFLIVRTAAIGWQFGGKPPMELMNNPFLKLVNNQYVLFSPAEKLATIVYTLGAYVKLLFIPAPLTHDYYPRHVDIMTFSSLKVMVSLLLHIGLLYIGFKGLMKKSIVGFGILFYLITLFIVSNLPFPIGTNMSERFLFMPSVGFCLIIAYLLHYFVKNSTTSLAIIGVVSIIFGAMTISRNSVWESNYTLFLHDVKTSVNSAKLQNACGGELLAQSIKKENEAKKTQMQQQAVGHLEQAIKTHPTYRNAYLLLGNAHNYLKNYEKSIEAYQKCLALDDTYKDAINNLSFTYRDAGKASGEKQDLNKAVSYLEKAYQLNQQDAETIRLLGVANGIGGNGAKAIEWFEKAVKLSPKNAHAWWDLGTAYLTQGNMEKGNECRATAKTIEPNIEQNLKQ